jgi:uncharacterized protein
MRPILVACVLAWFGGIAHADDIDTPDSRRIAAERYLLAVDQNSIAKTAEAMLAAIPEERQQAVRTVLSNKALEKRLQDVHLLMLVKHYTTQELDAMADYYASPLGKSATAKSDAFMADMMPELFNEIGQAMKQEMAKSPAKK